MWSIFCFLSPLFLPRNVEMSSSIVNLKIQDANLGPPLAWIYFKFTYGSQQSNVENNKFLTFWWYQGQFVVRLWHATRLTTKAGNSQFSMWCWRTQGIVMQSWKFGLIKIWIIQNFCKKWKPGVSSVWLFKLLPLHRCNLVLGWTDPWMSLKWLDFDKWLWQVRLPLSNLLWWNISQV